VPAVSVPEFRRRVELHRSLLEGEQRLSKDQAAEIIRLSNTAGYYAELGEDPAVADFVEQVRRRFADRIAPVLEMDVTRGFALRSEELDLTFGGTLPEGSRYRISHFEDA
jgi:hypothetical protein